MKRTLSILGMTLLAGSVFCAPAQVAKGSVEPDRGPVKAAPQLSPAERERLISLTRVVVPAAAAGPAMEAPAVAQRGPEVLARQVEAVDQLLAKLSLDSSSAASELMQKLLDSPEPAFRVTALHWLSGRRDVAADSIARALTDNDSLVRMVAENLLVERGLSDEAIAKVKAAVSKSKDDLRLEVRDAIASVRQ